MKRIETILKREAIFERKDSIKPNWYQQRDAPSFSKTILSPFKDIKEKIAVFNAMLKVDLL